MRLTLFYFILMGFIGQLHAQTYQTVLINKLNTENGLPTTPVSLLPATESGTFAIVSNYGGATTNLTVTGQIFKDIQSRTVAQGADPWTAGHIELEAAGITLGKDYPLPIVDHDEARKKTLVRYSVVKKIA